MRTDDSFGKNLKQNRQLSNLTLKELSEKTNISDATLQRYENGKIKNIPFDKIERIVSAFEEATFLEFDWKFKCFFLAFQSFKKLAAKYSFNRGGADDYLYEVNVASYDFDMFNHYYGELDRFQQIEFIQFALKEISISNKERQLELNAFLEEVIGKVEACKFDSFILSKYSMCPTFLTKYGRLDERGRNSVEQTLEYEYSYIKRRKKDSSET